MLKRNLALLALAAAVSLPARAALTGEQIYQETCHACHAAGLQNAPRFGDAKAWAPLIGEGQHVLTAHAFLGVRAMPPSGGRPTLTLEEFARAVAFMARAAGASWQDPDARLLARIQAEVEKRKRSLRDAAK